MKQHSLISIACSVVALISTLALAKEPSSINYVPGEILVKYKNNADVIAISNLNSSFGALKKNDFTTVRIQQLKLPSEMSVDQAINYYSKNPNIAYVERNYIVHTDLIPNDPDLDELWGLYNKGQLVNGITGKTNADIDALNAWDIETGDSNPVVIAVIDTGVAYNHPDLKANIWRNPGEINCEDGNDDDGNGYIDDCHGWDFIGDDNDPRDYDDKVGHGTHVAGTIAAVGNNSVGTTGVMWKAQIMPIRFIGVSGAGTTADAIAAIEYANKNGAHIINNSWGGGEFSQALWDVINASNAVIVCAAGNDGLNNDITPHFPSSYPNSNIISVAATDSGDNLASFSNYGISSVDVAAPGVNIYSSVPTHSYGESVGVYSENFDGDSVTLASFGWTTGGTPFPSTWEVTSDTGKTRGKDDNSLEDSPDGKYANNTNSWAGYTNSGTSIKTVKDNIYTLTFKWKGNLEADYDFLNINYSANSFTWEWIDRRTGTARKFTQDSTTEFTLIADLLPDFYFGFGLSSDKAFRSNGVRIDDVELTRTPIKISGHSYAYIAGTSMATPHVSGIAGLLKALDPSLTNSEIIETILKSVDTMSSLENRIATGGRVNAYKALLAAQEKTSGFLPVPRGLRH